MWPATFQRKLIPFFSKTPCHFECREMVRCSHTRKPRPLIHLYGRMVSNFANFLHYTSSFKSLPLVYLFGAKSNQKCITFSLESMWTLSWSPASWGNCWYREWKGAKPNSGRQKPWLFQLVRNLTRHVPRLHDVQLWQLFNSAMANPVEPWMRHYPWVENPSPDP